MTQQSTTQGVAAARAMAAPTVSRRMVLSGFVASVSFLGGCSATRFGASGSRQAAQSDGPGRAALLAPLTGRAPQLGQIMRDAATLGGNVLSDTGEMSLHDTGDSPETAAAAARTAIAGGARIIVGPLFGTQARAVAAVAGSKVPVLTLSNDSSVAGGGVFVMGITPQQSAQSVLAFAARRGLDSVGIVVTPGEFGARSARAAQEAGRALGQTVLDPIVQTDPAAAVSQLRAAGGGALPKAVYLPGAGAELEGLAAAFQGQTQLLGSTQWSSIDPTGVAALRGAWYAAPDPVAFEPFAVAWEDAHGTVPGILAGIAFDAIETARLLGRIGEQTTGGLLREKGFNGVIGPYRFLRGGMCSRGLAVVNVGAGAITLIGAATS